MKYRTSIIHFTHPSDLSIRMYFIYNEFYKQPVTLPLDLLSFVNMHLSLTVASDLHCPTLVNKICSSDCESIEFLWKYWHEYSIEEDLCGVYDNMDHFQKERLLIEAESSGAFFWAVHNKNEANQFYSRLKKCLISRDLDQYYELINDYKSWSMPKSGDYYFSLSKLFEHLVKKFGDSFEFPFLIDRKFIAESVIKSIGNDYKLLYLIPHSMRLDADFSDLFHMNGRLDILPLDLNDSELLFKRYEEDEIRVADQIWMTRNLSVSRFRNGDLIREARSDEDWVDALHRKEPIWCYYNYDASNGHFYGKLYNFYAVIDPRGLAPLGWKIPSEKDWLTLFNSVGGIQIAGSELKSKFWNENVNIVQEFSKFDALPAGMMPIEIENLDYNNIQCEENNCACFWSVSKSSESTAIVLRIEYDYSDVNIASIDMVYCCSVRCLKSS